ncbi:MAG: hypothetical protein KME07_05170 [Pegethrix bostrychoides GSE-TBD4-15B]|jgi:hypothetical protein|uniref:Uncharacterized protein n=1 Tax=Pegethrix bostrychoides GSE-TBD4-15B TaxID=2839662 RepID=A0A951P8R6_9CYAN|nr:hypothetical protein [Pegethrix bostrychoides GSE-TBD4-15B]
MARSSESAQPDRLRDVQQHPKNHPLLYLLNRFVVIIAIASIVGLLLASVAQTFSISSQAGLRSLAAALLPPILLTYRSFFAQSNRAVSRTLEQNLFLVAILWIVMLLVLLNLMALRFNYSLPLGEFVTSLTLAGLFYFNHQLSSRSMVSCGYGILSGLVLYLLIFGLPGG